LDLKYRVFDGLQKYYQCGTAFSPKNHRVHWKIVIQVSFYDGRAQSAFDQNVSDFDVLDFENKSVVTYVKHLTIVA